MLVLKRNWFGETMRVGDTVFRSMSVADISLIDKMEAEMRAGGGRRLGLAKGKKAEAIIEALPGQPFAAQVKQVEAVAKRRQPGPRPSTSG